MEDVLDLYEEPYDPQYPTVCLDEKPVVLHADVQPSLPVESGKPERVDYEYERLLLYQHLDELGLSEDLEEIHYYGTTYRLSVRQKLLREAQKSKRS